MSDKRSLVQMHTRGDRLDRRQIGVIVGMHVGLVGGREVPAAARARLRVDLEHPVRVGAERAGDAGPALAPLLRRLRNVGLLTLGRWQRGIAGGLGRDQSWAGS